MKLRQMEVFHAVMSAGSVTGAAKLLNLSQPAVTNLLRYTEDQLNFKLFDRVKGRLRPTPEAITLFGEVQQVFDSVRSVRRLAEDLREARGGVLNMVTTPSLGIITIPLAVASFLEEHPDVRIRIHVRQRASAIEMVASQSVDIGITFLPVTHPKITAHELRKEALSCIFPRNHPLSELAEVSAADIANYPMISYTNSQGVRPLIDDAFAETDVQNIGVVEVSFISTAWSLVNSGVGVALVDPYSRFEEIYPDVQMRPLVPGKQMPLEMLHPYEKPLSAVATRFAEHLARHTAR